jgi:hypothetical protein
MVGDGEVLVVSVCAEEETEQKNTLAPKKNFLIIVLVLSLNGKGIAY